jgi:hypothetical protein
MICLTPITCQYQIHGYKARNMILKTVTLQEANGLLPLVREHFFRIHVMLAHLQHMRGNLPKKPLRSFVIDKSQETISIIKRKSHNKKYKTQIKEIREIEHLIEKEINDIMRLGAIIKSLVPPHIDFFSIRNQEPIFLCWHGGETEIKHWHHLDDGSPFRQIIQKKNPFGPHMVH